MSSSAYLNQPTSDWSSITKSLIDAHPLRDSIVRVVLESWDALFTSNIGGLTIGKELLPAPQIIGFLLESLIAHKLSVSHPGKWKRGTVKSEKDVVCLFDNSLSIEIKCSSSLKQIFANRSYAQPVTVPGAKSKDSFYLAINFQDVTKPLSFAKPQITQIRFGFLDHSDWIPQASATGQSARLTPAADKSKLMVLYPDMTQGVLSLKSS